MVVAKKNANEKLSQMRDSTILGGLNLEKY